MLHTVSKVIFFICFLLSIGRYFMFVVSYSVVHVLNALFFYIHRIMLAALSRLLNFISSSSSYSYCKSNSIPTILVEVAELLAQPLLVL
jgi:hypothetical protein